MLRSLRAVPLPAAGAGEEGGRAMKCGGRLGAAGRTGPGCVGVGLGAEVDQAHVVTVESDSNRLGEGGTEPGRRVGSGLLEP